MVFSRSLTNPNPHISHLKPHMSSLWKERLFSRKKKKDAYGPLGVQLRAKLWAALCVDPSETEKMYVTLVQVCPLYLTLFPLRACTLWGGAWFTWVFLCLCSISLWHVPREPLLSKPRKRKVFFYQATLYVARVYFLPSWELIRAPNFVSVLSWWNE